MNRLVTLIVILTAAILSACGSATPTLPAALQAPTPAVTPATPTQSIAPVPPTQQATVPSRVGVIRTISPNPVGLRNIAFLIALDTLRQQGYTVETTQIATTDLVATALIKGDLDIAYFSDQLAWAASAKGAPVRTIASFNGDPYLIAAKLDIKTCADLQNKNMAYGSATTVNAAMLDQYIKRTCPGTKPQMLVIASSPARFAALLSGQIDSVLLETDDALQLERQAPGRFQILRLFAEEFPLIEVGGYHVHADFAGKHPEIVKDFVRALIQAHRRVQDKQVLRDAVAKYLANDATALAAADTYLAQNAWDVNGGLTPQRVQSTLDFLIGANMLPVGLKADQVANLSYLDAVLDEIGRQ